MSTVPDLATAYQARLRRLAGATDRVDTAFNARSVSKTDLDLLYESTFLAAVAEFEATLEEMLVEAVCGARPKHSGRYALLKPKSRAAFRSIMLHNRAFNEMLPYPRALDLAALYLNDRGPFAAVSSTDRLTIQESVLIRNAIAHRSGSALQKFRRDVQWVSRLPANRQRPGPFLRQILRRAPIQTRHDAYFAGLASAVGSIAAAW